MRYQFILLLSLFLALLSSWRDTCAVVVYLKWERELTPRIAGPGWQTGAEELDQALNRYSLRDVKLAVQQNLDSDPVGLRRVLQLDLQREEEVIALLSELRSLPGTAYAESAPVRQIHGKPNIAPTPAIQTVPGDPLYGTQWFFPVMQAPSAWDLSLGSGVVVAVVDNGTDWLHPDLQENIWTNPNEIGGNGIDDDQNGFIDDLQGWDFVASDNDPAPTTPDDYHGTHTAGLVAALMDNGRGVVGMAPGCKLMPLKGGTGDYITHGIQGMIYAAHNGADVLSLSWGGSASNSFEQDVITDALLEGCLVVAAAGNSNSSAPHYPAAYEGVLAVGATDLNDVRAVFSNYGEWVSVCAPGVAIWSLIPDGYGSSSGTSMSTPITAGVAALVKATHPGWSVEQIRNQIIYTTDNIYPLNPLYPGLLGSGRVNAYRAVAESAPGLRVLDLAAVELSGDGDGKIESGETAQLILSLINDGANTTNVQITLGSSAAYVQINQASWITPQFTWGDTLDNSAQPFEVFITGSAPVNVEAPLSLNVEAENFYSAILAAELLINPVYANHDVGNVVFTLTEFGAYGYYDPFRQVLYGSGFRFPPNGSNALFHGSFLAGISSQQVSDNAYGGTYIGRFDWTVLPDSGEITMGSGSVAQQEGWAVFQDTVAPPIAEQVGLEVRQHSYAWDDPIAEDFVILSFSVKNISGAPLNNLYTGLYLDWDVPYSYENSAGWNSNLSLGYVYNGQPLAPNTRYYGTALLTNNLVSYRVVDLIYDLVYYTMTDSQKYAFMSAGMVKTQSSALSDQATILSAGPFSLGVGDSAQVAYAVLGGETLDDLAAQASAAQERWNEIDSDFPLNPAAPLIEELKIRTVYPQPANGGLTIKFVTPAPGEVQIHLVDLQGRRVGFWRESYAQAGVYHLSLPQPELASGVYFLRVVSPLGSDIRKIVWLK